MEFTLKAKGLHVLELIKRPAVEKMRGGEWEMEIKSVCIRGDTRKGEKNA